MPGPPASVFQAVPSRGAAPSCRHQFRNRDTQCPGETLDIVETDIALPAFDSAQIVAMNAGQIGQGLLAEFALTPKSPQIYCQHLSGASGISFGHGGRLADDHYASTHNECDL